VTAEEGESPVFKLQSEKKKVREQNPREGSLYPTSARIHEGKKGEKKKIDGKKGNRPRRRESPQMHNAGK